MPLPGHASHQSFRDLLVWQKASDLASTGFYIQHLWIAHDSGGELELWALSPDS